VEENSDYVEITWGDNHVSKYEISWLHNFAPVSKKYKNR